MAMQWYVLRVQSNREDSVKESLEKRVKMAGLEGKVAQIIVPSEQITEIRSGKKRIVGAQDLSGLPHGSDGPG